MNLRDKDQKQILEPHNLEILRKAFPTNPIPWIPLSMGKNDLKIYAHTQKHLHLNGGKSVLLVSKPSLTQYIVTLIVLVQ